MDSRTSLDPNQGIIESTSWLSQGSQNHSKHFGLAMSENNLAQTATALDLGTVTDRAKREEEMQPYISEHHRHSRR